MSGRLTSAEQALIEAAETWVDRILDAPDEWADDDDLAIISSVAALRLEREDNRETYQALEEEGWTLGLGASNGFDLTNPSGTVNLLSVTMPPMWEVTVLPSAPKSEASAVRLARSLSSLLEERP